MNTYVPRKQPKGTKYQIEIIFQGDDHLDKSEALEQSTNVNTQPWQISHPLYGSILVQPLSLTFDNAVLNISNITGMVIETISIDVVSELKISPKNKMFSEGETILGGLVDNLSITTPKLDAVTKQNFIKSLTQSYNSVAQWVTNTSDANEYLNAFNTSTSILNTIGANTVDIARGVQRFTSMPYTFSDNVVQKIQILKTQYNIIIQSANNLFKRNSKKLAEFQLSNILVATVLSTITGATYNNADEVEGVLGDILDMMDGYVFFLDGISSPNNTNEDSYQPDYETITRLSFLVSFTNDVLLSIMQNAKIKRTYTLSNDMTIFEVVHKVYGYDAKDENLNKIIAENNIGLKELFMLKKGKTITYYK